MPLRLRVAMAGIYALMLAFLALCAIVVYGLATLYSHGWVRCDEHTGAELLSPDAQYSVRVWRQAARLGEQDYADTDCPCENREERTWTTLYQSSAPPAYVDLNWRTDDDLVVRIELVKPCCSTTHRVAKRHG